jgi:hypothetical protein
VLGWKGWDCSFLSTFLSSSVLASGLPWAPACAVGDAGFEGGGVCCAAAGKESKIAIAKATNCRVANSIGKHPSKCRDNEALR